MAFFKHRGVFSSGANPGIVPFFFGSLSCARSSPPLFQSDPAWLREYGRKESLPLRGFCPDRLLICLFFFFSLHAGHYTF